MTGFRFHPEAEIDLNEIWDFIAEDGVDAPIAYATTSSQQFRISLRLPTKVIDAVTCFASATFLAHVRLSHRVQHQKNARFSSWQSCLVGAIRGFLLASCGTENKRSMPLSHQASPSSLSSGRAHDRRIVDVGPKEHADRPEEAR